MIDKPIIEALASLGTGITPRFQWNADALSLKSAIDSLAVNRISLPAACEDYEALMAMAMGLHITKQRTSRSDLPEKQFRRVATLSMQFGAALAEVATILKTHEEKVTALLSAVQDTDPLANGKPTLQTLLIAATCASKMPQGEGIAVMTACQKLLLATGAKQELITMMAYVMDAVQAAETTKDFASIAQAMFPDIGEQCTDAIDDDQVSESLHDQQIENPSAQPGQASEEARQGSDGNEFDKTADGQSAQTQNSQPGNKDGSEQPENHNGNGSAEKPADAAGAESYISESESNSSRANTSKGTSLSVDQEALSDSVSQSQSAEASSDNESEQTSEDKFSACTENGQEEKHNQGDVPVVSTGSSQESDDSKAASEVNSQEPTAKGSEKAVSDLPIEGDLEKAQDSASMKGSLGEVQEKACANKLQFAKNQFLVSELVRILQSEDKRTTSIEDRGRKIATNKVWRLKKLGDTRVFKQTTKVVGSQIAVELLIDGSASMSGSIQLACEVGLSFCDALQRLSKSSSAMSVFAGKHGVSQVLKEHHEGFAKIATKLTSVFASGGTPTGQAMMQRLEVLARQRQERKLMVVITDGAANDYRSVLNSMQYAHSHDIEVIGIGIGLEGRVVKTYIQNSLSILSLNELQPAIRKLMFNRAQAHA